MSYSMSSTHLRFKKDLVEELMSLKLKRGLPSVDALVRQLLASQISENITDNLTYEEANTIALSVFFQEAKHFGAWDRVKLGVIVGKAMSEVYKASREKKKNEVKT
jgi:hypothetical protein